MEVEKRHYHGFKISWMMDDGDGDGMESCYCESMSRSLDSGYFLDRSESQRPESGAADGSRYLLWLIPCFCPVTAVGSRYASCGPRR